MLNMSVPVLQVSNILTLLHFVVNNFFFQLVYLSAILEYLATEILELAGNLHAAHDNKKQCIVPRHFQLPFAQRVGASFPG